MAKGDTVCGLSVDTCRDTFREVLIWVDILVQTHSREVLNLCVVGIFVRFLTRVPDVSCGYTFREVFIYG